MQCRNVFVNKKKAAHKHLSSSWIDLLDKKSNNDDPQKITSSL